MNGRLRNNPFLDVDLDAARARTVRQRFAHLGLVLRQGIALQEDRTRQVRIERLTPLRSQPTPHVRHVGAFFRWRPSLPPGGILGDVGQRGRRGAKEARFKKEDRGLFAING